MGFENINMKIYLAIDISLSVAKAVLWATRDQEEEQVKILGLGSSEFYRDEKGLLEAVESSLNTAWSLGSPEFQLERKVAGVIFAIPQSWMGEQLKTEKLSLLRHISREMAVEPLGFVSEAEILLSYLKEKEGKFLNLVIVSVGDEWIDVTPIWQGKILGSQLIERSDNITLDLEEGLSRFEIKTPFSPRILILGRGDLEEIRQTILSYPWLETEKALFLHLPKVEIFPSRLVVETLVVKMGEETILKEKTDFDSREEISLTEEGVLGFLKNKDVAQLESPPSPSPQVSVELSPPEPAEEEKENAPFFLTRLLKRTKSLSEKSRETLGNFKKIRLPRFLVMLFLSFLLILVALFIAWWYLPKAEITLLVEPRFSEENFLLAVSSDITTIDVENKIIPGRVLDLEVSGQKTIETKGKKKVGDKAVGEVIIYNGTDIAKTFPVGTSLEGSSEMEFLTKAAVTVASRSGSIIEGWVSGQEKAAVEAADIGADYNLAGGTEFKIGLFSGSDFIAKNEKEFSGGSSRDIKVVDKEDQEQLRESLKEELLADGEKKLKEELNEGEDLIEENIDLEIVSEDFDHKIDDEADNIFLTLKLKISTLAFLGDDIDVLAEEVLKNRIPEGFILGEKKELDFKFLRQEKNKAIFDFGIKANLYPQIDEEKIKKEVLGKRPQSVQQYLSSLSGVDGFEISIDPRLPKYLLTFPHRRGNIKVIMKIKI